MDDQHVLTLVEAIHGADFYTIHQLTFDATLIDYIGHLSFPRPGRQASRWPTRTTAFAGSAINIPMAVFSAPIAGSSVTRAMPLGDTMRSPLSEQVQAPNGGRQSR
jgi:hypothetical protein